jgi:protein O-GlcNAc transferase
LATEKNSIGRCDLDTPGDVSGLISQAWRLRARTELGAAALNCEKALKLKPENDEGWHLLGLVRWDLGEREAGIACLRRAIELNPRQPLHYNTLGVMLIEAGDHVCAGTCLEAALKLSPGFHDARSNMGLALFHRNKLGPARRCFEEVLRSDPDHREALANLGMVHLAAGEMRQAALAYEKALSTNPDHPRWQGNLGAAYLAMARFEDAARCFRSALSALPDNSSYFVSLGIALRAMGDYQGSIEVLEYALKVAADSGPALANLVVAYQQTCQWTKLGPLVRRLDDLLQASLAKGTLPVEQPLMHVRRCAEPAVNLAVARAWSRDAERRALKSAERVIHSPPCPSDRITVGYLSYDFRDHPVSHQLFPLFGLHDRCRFRVKTFSMGPDDGSTFRRDIRNNSEVFIDLNGEGLSQVVRKIVEQRVDILIDLMGHTHHNRMEVLALRPAPLQVSWLGFLASTGADFIDYIIADKVVVPEAQAGYYSEKIIRMPHCYQMNHRFLSNNPLPERRGDWHLPEDGFVFCCFNQAYKIEPDLFSTWMHILNRVPQSVLWLFCEQPSVAGRLRQVAMDCRIDPQRIVFAGKLPLKRHLCRLRLADLALDTMTYNGGATTANCLLAGVPVLTVLGNHWVSRMSASHLLSAGLPELVARDLSAYEAEAIHLAQHPHELDALRHRLRCAHADAPLFRPEEFVKDLEAAYEIIWQRRLNGQAPADIWLDSAASSSARSPSDGWTASPQRMDARQ